MATASMSSSRMARQHDDVEWGPVIKIFLAVLLVILLLLQFKLWSGNGNLFEVWQLRDAIERQKIENSQLKQRNDALEAEVDDLKKGLAAIEERARKELGMIKKGETFFQIVEEPIPAQKAAQ
jgi:cell division protein FtsB